MKKGEDLNDPRPLRSCRCPEKNLGRFFNRDAAGAARYEFWSSSFAGVDGDRRATAVRDGAICAERMTAFASVPALPARTGAFIAKKAAETIRKVWIFLVFMRTPFLTALLS
jgi:hypothetical protein